MFLFTQESSTKDAPHSRADMMSIHPNAAPKEKLFITTGDHEGLSKPNSFVFGFFFVFGFGQCWFVVALSLESEDSMRPKQ